MIVSDSFSFTEYLTSSTCPPEPLNSHNQEKWLGSVRVMLQSLRNWFCGKLAVVRNRLYRRGDGMEKSPKCRSVCHRQRFGARSTCLCPQVRSSFIQTKLPGTRFSGPDDVSGVELQNWLWPFTYFLCPCKWQPATGTRPEAPTLQFSYL